MNIDCHERHLDAILEYGEWRMDCAVEAAIKRNDWQPPAPEPALTVETLLAAKRYMDEVLSAPSLFGSVNPFYQQQMIAQQQHWHPPFGAVLGGVFS